MQRFRTAFQRLPDPRADNARYDLLEVLFIALAAMLCGADGCSEMEEFGQSKEGLLRLFLRLEHGIPSHDTFSRVFRLLKPQAFENAFRRFMAAFAKANGFKLSGVVAVDGKALRGAYERDGRATPLQLVNVFAVDAQALISDCSKQNSDQHKLRRALQDVVKQRFGGDLIAFADTLWASSKYVAQHLFELCTETFLIQLFFLFPNPEMVLEARAKMLDWFAYRFKESAAAERAKAIRLDQKLHKIGAKSTIRQPNLRGERAIGRW